MRTDGIKYGGQCSCGAQIIKAGDGEWHCPKCKKDDILARAEEYLAMNPIHCPETDEIFRQAIANARELSDQNEDLMAHCNDLRTRCWNAEQEALRWQEKAVEERARNLRDAEVSLYGNLSSAYIKDYYREARRELCISSTSSVTEKEAGDLPGSRPKEDYESVTTCINCGAKADQIRPDKDWYLGGIFLDPGSPGNECEPPEPAYGYFECRECRPMVLLTPERRAALEAMANLRTEIMCPKCGAWIGFDDIKPHMQVHRDMLEGKP